MVAEISNSVLRDSQSRLPCPMNRCPIAKISSRVASNAGSASPAASLIASSRFASGEMENTSTDGA